MLCKRLGGINRGDLIHHNCFLKLLTPILSDYFPYLQRQTTLSYCPICNLFKPNYFWTKRRIIIKPYKNITPLGLCTLQVSAVSKTNMIAVRNVALIWNPETMCGNNYVLEIYSIYLFLFRSARSIGFRQCLAIRGFCFSFLDPLDI
jgi:hypothetical protein